MARISSPARRRIHVIVNPISGRKRHRSVVREFLQRLALTDCRFDFCVTGEAEEVARAARLAGCSGADVLVVVGGDGTVRMAVEGLAGRRVPILIVPCGTENVLAKGLGIVLECDRLLEILERGAQMAFDLGRCGVRTMVFVAGVGFDAEVVRRLAASRRGHISYVNYVMPLLRTFLDYRPPQLRLEVDGERVFDGRGQVIIGNIARYAFGMRIAGQAVASDGIFDACVFAYRRRVTLLWHVMTALSGQHEGLPGVHCFRGRRFRVESDEPAPVQLDGDAAGTTPVEVSVQEHKAVFLVPGGL